MKQDEIVKELPGSQKVLNWFGVWPSFHDAEVVSIELHRNSESYLRIHTFSTRNEVNKTGHYITDRHAMVCFTFEGISEMSLNDFNNQNVLSELSIGRVSDQFELVLGQCYGVAGRVLTKRLSVDFVPGMPDGSVYASTVPK